MKGEHVSETDTLRREIVRLRNELARSDATAAWLAKECVMLTEAAKKERDPVLGNLEGART